MRSDSLYYLKMRFHGSRWAVIALVSAGCRPVQPSPPVTGVADLGGAWESLAYPVWEGMYPEYGTAGDPSVLVTEGGYQMVYTDYDVDFGGADVWSATSVDGVDWDQGPRALTGRTGEWDAAHETAYLLDDQTLYALGYPDPASGFVSGSDVGRWRRSGGTWTLSPGEPVLARATAGLDIDGITSPTVVAHPSGGWFMAYTGWCWACVPVVSLLGAESADGITWSRLPSPLVVDPGLSWSPGGIAETHLVEHDGTWWLFFSSIDDGRPHQIGLAEAAAPEGPWSFHPEPIISGESLGDWGEGGVVAPHLVVEGGRARIWFAGQDATGNFRIGLASLEAPAVE